MSKTDNYIYEQLAKKILERYCEHRYEDLNKDDRPDLQDMITGIGVEVTRAGEAEEFELSSIFGKMMGKKAEELTDKDRRRLEKKKIFLVELNDDALSSSMDEEYPEENHRTFYTYGDFGISIGATICQWVHNDNLMNAIETKIGSINKADYGIFDKYDLFVFADRFQLYEKWIELSEHTENEVVPNCRCMAFDIMDDINDIQKGMEKRFSIVYVLNQKMLYEFDMEGRKYRCRDIDMTSLL